MESNIEDNFRMWWLYEGSTKYHNMLDDDVSMLKIIEMIFDAGQMAALDDAKQAIGRE